MLHDREISELNWQASRTAEAARIEHFPLGKRRHALRRQTIAFVLVF
jgi:hypothetical protein